MGYFLVLEVFYISILVNKVFICFVVVPRKKEEIDLFADFIVILII